MNGVQVGHTSAVRHEPWRSWFSRMNCNHYLGFRSPGVPSGVRLANVDGRGGCWRETSTGYAYRVKEREPRGSVRAELTFAGRAPARIHISGKGEGLGLPIDLEVRSSAVAQMSASDGRCWEATYRSRILSRRVGRFRAEADSPG